MRSGWRGLTTVAAIGAAMGMALVASGCSASTAEVSGSSGSGGGKIAAVGAENEYADVIQQVGGKYVQVSAIMSNPNTDPHTFEASASVARLVSAAQLVVQNGVGYDTVHEHDRERGPELVTQGRRGAEPARPAGQHPESAPVVPAGHHADRRERRCR